jgi:hypothetical protein
LGVRLLWSLIAIFGKDGKSKIAGSDPWVNFGTGILEEFVIVCVCVCVCVCGNGARFGEVTKEPKVSIDVWGMMPVDF